jgi:hypothetical protein
VTVHDRWQMLNVFTVHEAENDRKLGLFILITKKEYRPMLKVAHRGHHRERLEATRKERALRMGAVGSICAAAGSESL